LTQIARRTAALRGAVYSDLAAEFHAFDGEKYPFHVGDTWLQPPATVQGLDERLSDARYLSTQGNGELIELLAARYGVSTDQVLVTTGATAGLHLAVGAIADSGQTVLLQAPYWPLIEGMSKAQGVQTVPVPFRGGVEDLLDALDAAYSETVAALYLNTPNNPTGRVLTENELRALAEWARRRDVWLLSDEVYDHLVLDGQHVSVAEFAPERTIVAHSLSKNQGLSGYRVGWLVGPKDAIAAARKLHTHAAYNVSAPCQRVAVRALGDTAWTENARAAYADVARRGASILGVPAPAGSTFFFLNVSSAGPTSEVLRDAVKEGILAAPGQAFGGFDQCIRVCFTATEPEVTLRGLQKLRAILDSRGWTPKTW